MASPVTTSSITLLNLVSLCVMRSGIVPLAIAFEDHVHDRLVLERELDLRAGVAGAVVVVLLNGLLQRGEPLAGVVEVGDGLDRAARPANRPAGFWNSPNARPAW